MDIHAYVTVDGTSTAGNGVDFGSDASATAFDSDFVVQIDAGDTEQTFDFYAIEDNRYEEAQTAVFDLNVYAAGESGKTTATASNATIDSDGEKFTFTINASGVDELPIAEWVSPDGSGFPYAGISTSQVDEDDATISITLQLNRYTEKILQLPIPLMLLIVPQPLVLQLQSQLTSLIGHLEIFQRVLDTVHQLLLL